MTSRRNFLRSTALSAAAAGMASWTLPGGTKAAHTGSSTDRPDGANLRLGIAGYTFLNVPVDGAIAMMKRVGVNQLSIKDFHLPLNSSEDTINTVRAKFNNAGITIYAAGVIYMKTQAEVDTAFDYAKKLGVGMIVAAPNPELLSYVEQKVKATNILIAIHNHGPEDKLYPSPADVYNRVKGLDARMGLCLDIGHAARAGADPVKAVIEYAPRLFDLHIKDLSRIEKQVHPIELGRGVLDIPGLVRALKTVSYAGRCSIEHEMDMKDPLPGVAESAGYFRGVVKTLE